MINIAFSAAYTCIYTCRDFLWKRSIEEIHIR